MGLYQGDKPLILADKSAYQLAVDAGYTGTQAEFYKLLAILPPESKQIKWDNKEESGAAAQALIDAKTYAEGLSTNYDKAGMAMQALTDAKNYTDSKLKSIPTPDVSGQINAHNQDATAHADIREALSKAGSLVIHVNVETNSETGKPKLTLDKTYAEIANAFNSGRNAVMVLSGKDGDYDIEQLFELTGAFASPTINGTVTYYRFEYVETDNTLVTFGAISVGGDDDIDLSTKEVPTLSDYRPRSPGNEASPGTELYAARCDHVHPKEVSDTDRANWNGKASKPKACLVTLKSSSWDADAKTQVATVASVVADEAAQMIHPMPKIGQITTYNDSGIQLIAQGDGNVTFMCDTIPTENVDVWVVTEDVEDVTPPPPTVSVAPKPSVNYTAGLSGLEAADVTAFAQAISNCTDVTNETTIVYVDHGDVHRKISVGDQVTLPLNGTNYAFDVIGFNHDALTTPTAYGVATATGKAGITFQMHDLFGTYFAMNDTRFNVGGWKDSKMRTSTMVTMKGYLPSDWQTAIKLVNKASGTGGGSSSGTETVSDSCFLLAEVEIFRSTAYSVAGEGTQYAYYKAGNSKVKHKNGSAYHWLERSPCSGDRAGVCFVSDAGAPSGGNVDAAIGVAFAFCV